MKCFVGLLTGMMLLAAGCAHNKVERFEVGARGGGEENAEKMEDEHDSKGLRYYEEAPFILVYSQQGKYAAELIYLPDTSVIHTLTPTNILAVNNLELTFKDGVLTSSKTSTDTTTIPATIIEVAKSIALQAVTGGAEALAMKDPIHPSDPNTPMVYLFRYGIDDGKHVLYVDGEPIPLRPTAEDANS